MGPITSNLSLQEREKALNELQVRIRSCCSCQEYGYIVKAHPIVSGRCQDRIMVIGQAPGHLSVSRGRPFSGPGGKILQSWLEQAGFPQNFLHEHCYLSSLTRCDPGKNLHGKGDRKPSIQERTLCYPYLEEELRLVQPRIVLLVGSMAIEAFFQGKRRLIDVIGTYQVQDGIYFLPLPHPSGLSRWLNEPANKKLHQQALVLLARWRSEFGLV